MASETKHVVVDVEDKPLATGDSSGQKEESFENRDTFFYKYCGGNPVTALITPSLTLGAVLVIVLGIASIVCRPSSCYL